MHCHRNPKGKRGGSQQRFDRIFRQLVELVNATDFISHDHELFKTYINSFVVEQRDPETAKRIRAGIRAEIRRRYSRYATWPKSDTLEI